MSANRFCAQNNSMATKTTTKSIFDARYALLIDKFIRLRKSKGLSQRDLAKLFGVSNCCIARVETRERRVDMIELIDYLRALKLTDREIIDFIAEIVNQH